MIWSSRRFLNSANLVIPVIKKTAVILLPLSLTMWTLKFAVSTLHHHRFDAPEDFSMGFVISVGLGAFILDTLLALVWFVVAVHATVGSLRANSPEGVPPSLLAHFHQTLIEDLRRTMSTILWTFAFIIPGLIRWIRLALSCHISLLNPSYQRGQRDALAHSSKLVRGHGWALGILLGFQILVTLGLQEVGSSFPTYSLPLALFYGFSWVSTLYFTIYVTLTYVALDPEVQL